MLPLLEGVRILDFTTVFPGPDATRIPGDLGADSDARSNLVEAGLGADPVRALAAAGVIRLD